MATEKRTSILIVDDQKEIVNSIERLLKDEYRVFKSFNGKSALSILKKNKIAVILADQRMPGMTGIELFLNSLSVSPHSIRIMITAYSDIEASIEAINKGKIFYYVSKPWEPQDLRLIIKRGVEQYQLRQNNIDLTGQLKEANIQLHQENIYLKKTISKEYNFKNMIGHSPKMLETFKLISKVIDTPTTVLLLGETGTGKEMIAKAIHYNSNKKDKILITQNCGALPDSLLESELFGHVKGAFTGAVADKKGIFELADGGTIFLDEIADTSYAMQLNLLRVLQDGEIRPVGSDKTKTVKVRVIAATNKNLEEEVKNGRFRKDLYYRINVFPVHLPPLRERREDIPDLIEYFINHYSQKLKYKKPAITQHALKLLQNALWPGNIRELQNEIERAVTLASDDLIINKRILSPRFINNKTEIMESGTDSSLKEQVEKLEKKLIKKSLEKNRGNILRTAKEIGISRPGLYKKIEKYRIDPDNL